MSIKDLYNWVVENGVEDYDLVNYFYDGKGSYSVEDFKIDREEKEVYSDFDEY